MAPALDAMSPELHYADNVAQTSAGRRLVYVSTKANGTRDDRFTCLVAPHRGDPINADDIAALPEVAFGVSEPLSKVCFPPAPNHT